MYKTDAAGNVSNEFSEAGSSTRVDAAFMNEVMYELLNVVLAGPLVPTKGTRTQVRDAIALMIAAAGGVPDATDTVKGKVELATTAEAIAGVDTVRAITAAGLKSMVDLYAKLNSAPTFTGQVTAPSFDNTSSKRYKTKIKSLKPEVMFDLLQQLRIVEFKNKRTGRHQFGVIAEEVFLIDGLAHSVSLDENDQPNSVDYQTLFMAGLSAMKHQEKQRRAIEKRLARLEALAVKNAK